MLFLQFQVEEWNIYILLPIPTFSKLQENMAQYQLLVLSLFAASDALLKLFSLFAQIYILQKFPNKSSKNIKLSKSK